MHHPRLQSLQRLMAGSYHGAVFAMLFPATSKGVAAYVCMVLPQCMKNSVVQRNIPEILDAVQEKMMIRQHNDHMGSGIPFLVIDIDIKTGTLSTVETAKASSNWKTFSSQDYFDQAGVQTSEVHQIHGAMGCQWT